MARWKKTSSEDKARVIEAKINNPDLSTRDIEKLTWVNRQTSSDILKKEIPEILSKSDTIAKLIDDNHRIMNITWLHILDKLKDWDKVSIRDLKDLRDFAIKQNTLLSIWDEQKRDAVITFEL